MSSICIGCGSTDARAGAGPWIRIDEPRHIGVCSSCIREVARWDAGDRSISTQAHQNRVTHCRTCHARIIWLKTPAGKNNPTDADSVKPEDTQFEWGRHISHFSTCPQRDQHRKAR